MRITALRAISPSRARMARMATNPSGFWKMRSVATIPISPIGTTLRTRKRRLKLCNCIIRTVTMMNSIRGTTAKTEACDCALSSTVNVIGPRQGGLQRCNRGGKRGNDPLGRRALRDVGLDGENGDSVAAPDQRKFPLELEGGELAERNGAAARERKLQIAQRLQRNALLV